VGPRLSSLIGIVLVGALAACGTSATTSKASPLPTGCHSGPPEAGVHNPDRLRVLAACQHASGIIVDVAYEDDGDYHLWFKVDPGYEFLLNFENHFQGRPALLGEITPDCPSETNPTSAAAAARCPKTNLPIPKVGDHIAVDGPWVLDVDHGWREIHPVDSIRILG
jgi:hypothetical protein